MPSKRKLYPSGRLDRRVLWTSLALLLSGFLVSRWLSSETGHLILLLSDVPLLLAGALLCWIVIYFIQDTSTDDFEDYSRFIAKIQTIGKDLSELTVFLKQQLQKVADSETTLRKLQDEKTQLEPVVATQRQTVNAILTAHSKTTGVRIWKERTWGFMSGIITSLLASVVFEYLRR